MDLVSYVMEKHDARLASDGHELVLECPICYDHKPRLFINLRTFRWICHHCGEAGALISFLEKVMELDPFEAYHVSTKLEAKPARVAPTTPQHAIEVLPGTPLTDPDDPIEHGFWEYLRGRRLADEDVLHYEMRYAVLGKYRGRVIIPVKQHHEVVGFAARAISAWTEPKVLYPQGMQTSKLLFGLDDLDDPGYVILTEGVFDAIRLRDAAVCTFGAHLSTEQRALLRQEGYTRVMMLWDGDDAGRRAAARMVRELKSDGFEVLVGALPLGVDPASASITDLTTAIDSAFKAKVELPRRVIRQQLSEE